MQDSTEQLILIRADISEAWMRKFWSVAKGKWSSLPTGMWRTPIIESSNSNTELDWPIIPTEDFKLVSRGRAEYIFIPPSDFDLKGMKLRLFDIMTKLQAMFLNTDICPPTNETRKMCLNIKPDDILLALRRVKPENCNELNSQDRNFLLETLNHAVSIECVINYVEILCLISRCRRRIAMEAKILKRLPLFETESETNPDYLVNLCADVICDNLKMLKNIPSELREQLEEYGTCGYNIMVDYDWFSMQRLIRQDSFCGSSRRLLHDAPRCPCNEFEFQVFEI